MTSFADRAAILSIEGAPVVGKPFSRDDLADKVTQVLAESGQRLSA
jgi:hypothetical protein